MNDLVNFAVAAGVVAVVTLMLSMRPSWGRARLWADAPAVERLPDTLG